MEPTLPRPAVLASVEAVHFPAGSPPVVRTAATLLCNRLGLPAPSDEPGPGLQVGLTGGAWPRGPVPPPPAGRPWTWIRLSPGGDGEVVASEPALLYAIAHFVAEGLPGLEPEALSKGLLLPTTFSWNRPLYDQVLTQTARSVRGFNPEAYVRRLAECGFTHVEVNGLATHIPFEPGVPNEYYNQFYTYCPALSQFVDSTLTRGLYPHEYLQANLNHLKRLAGLGRKYGLRPGLLCFEPRTLPEHFFDRYPTLRGARVDHPFRSHKPRYTLAQDHPATRDHYRQLMENLMREVPDLAYLSVWTNDSGSGFEHTASLYVGRNGGPYMIREWRSHEKIAEAAGRSALRWLRLLQETAAAVNPDFEVILRIEPFKVEHDVIMSGMGNGLAIEAPSLLVRGYHLPYHHPNYPEQESAAGTIFHVDMDDTEREKLAACRAQGFEPKLTYSAGSSFNLEPLLGIPYPRLLHRKLTALRRMDVRCVNAFGGLLHVEKTPYWPHPDVIRAVQLTPDVPIDAVLRRTAARFAGETHADELVGLWDRVEEAVSFLPLVPLYSSFGFPWMRTWVRPLVPDIEAIPREDRLYYERFLVSTPNNPSINDLGRDVLFDLITQESGRQMADQIDANVLPRLREVLDRVGPLAEDAAGPARAVFADLRDRIRALRCWAVTQRNTCAWVAGVYGYLETDDASCRAAFRQYLDEMIRLDLENTRELLDLWENSPTEFMLVSDVGETSSIFGENFGDLLRRKIELTEQYADRPPRIDRDILWRLE